MKNTVRTAVVGCGEISEIYLQNMINRFSVFDVAACCSEHGASAEKRACEFGIRALTFEEILKDASVELVVNLTPALAHYDVIKRSLLAGKNVYSEKIFTASYREACELTRIADDRNLRIGCAPDTFLGCAIQTAIKAVNDGLIGKITSAHAAVNRDCSCGYTPGRFTTQKGGGIGFDVGIYYLTALLSVLGPAESVFGYAVNTNPYFVFSDKSSPFYGQECFIDNENIMTANVLFRSGVIGTLNFNGNSVYPEKPFVTLYGTDGILCLPDPNRFGGKVMLMRRGDSDFNELPVDFGFSDNSRGVGPAEMAHSMLLGRPHRASSEMAVHAVEILCGIVSASESGTAQNIKSGFVPPQPLLPGYTENEEEALK